jgi:hypothetical protein
MAAVDHQNGLTATPAVCTTLSPHVPVTTSLTVSITTASAMGPPVRYAFLPSDRTAIWRGQ